MILGGNNIWWQKWWAMAWQEPVPCSTTEQQQKPKWLFIRVHFDTFLIALKIPHLVDKSLPPLHSALSYVLSWFLTFVIHCEASNKCTSSVRKKNLPIYLAIQYALCIGIIAEQLIFVIQLIWLVQYWLFDNFESKGPFAILL